MQSTIHHQTHHQRRLQSRNQSSSTTQLHHRLPQIFSGRLPSTTSSVPNDTNPNDSTSLPSSPSTTSTEEVDPNPTRTASSFLTPQQPTPNDKTSYSRLMHAHTTSQMTSPHTGTIPSYTRTMHALTLAQLNQMEKTSFSPTRSSNSNGESKATSAGETTRERRTHLQPPSMIALKLPPSQNHPASNPTPSPTTTCFQPQTSTPRTSSTQPPRPPTNTPAPSPAYEKDDPEALPRAFLPSENSRSTALLAADLRACERELERRFEMLAGDKAQVAAFLGGGGGLDSSGGTADVGTFSVAF